MDDSPKKEVQSQDDVQQQVIKDFGADVPVEVWQALEAVKPFLESRRVRPQFQTSLSGTGPGVRSR
jgi:hypothetical protein